MFLPDSSNYPSVKLTLKSKQWRNHGESHEAIKPCTLEPGSVWGVSHHDFHPLQNRPGLVYASAVYCPRPWKFGPLDRWARGLFESWNLELPWYTSSFPKFYEILLAISFQKCEGKHDIQLVVVCSKMSLESRTNACFFESVSSHPRTTSRNPSSKLKVCRQFPKCPHDPTKTNNIHIDPPKCFLLDILGHAHKLWSFVFLFICNSWENKQQNTILTVTEIHSAARRKRNLHNRAGNVVFLCVVDQSPTLTLTIWTSKLGKQTLIQLMIETYQHHIKHLLHLPHQERNNKKLQFLEPQKPFA